MLEVGVAQLQRMDGFFVLRKIDNEGMIQGGVHIFWGLFRARSGLFLGTRGHCHWKICRRGSLDINSLNSIFRARPRLSGARQNLFSLPTHCIEGLR
jgi:hypothetical protein